jgi:TonB family protein
MGVRGNPYFPKPPYPYTARQRGAEGICEVKITWSADGRVATVDIAKSSGQRDLDSNTLIHVKGRWHHPDPAKAHPVIVPVVYRMNEH